MTLSLRTRYDEALEQGRATLDRMKVDARLLRADLRDAKDSTLASLESAYDTLRRRARELPAEAGRLTGAMTAAAHHAYVDFRDQLSRARASGPDSN